PVLERDAPGSPNREISNVVQAAEMVVAAATLDGSSGFSDGPIRAKEGTYSIRSDRRDVRDTWERRKRIVTPACHASIGHTREDGVRANGNLAHARHIRNESGGQRGLFPIRSPQQPARVRPPAFHLSTPENDARVVVPR